MTVVAGSGGEAVADGSAEQAQFHDPQGVTVADDGIIYVSDTGNNAAVSYTHLDVYKRQGKGGRADAVVQHSP